jgi:hypothetical protein
VPGFIGSEVQLSSPMTVSRKDDVFAEEASVGGLAGVGRELEAVHVFVRGKRPPDKDVALHDADARDRRRRRRRTGAEERSRERREQSYRPNCYSSPLCWRREPLLHLDPFRILEQRT